MMLRMDVISRHATEPYNSCSNMAQNIAGVALGATAASAPALAGYTVVALE